MLGHARGKRRPQERGTKKMGYMKYLKLMNRMNAVTQVPQPPVPQFEKYCKLFVTDEEYDIMMGMKLRGNTEAELRALYTGSDWAGTLYDMCRKGFLLKIYDGAEPTYDLAPMLPGWFEFPLSTGEDSDTIQKASELFTSAINMVTTLNVEPLRTGYAAMNNLKKLQGDKGHMEVALPLEGKAAGKVEDQCFIRSFNTHIRRCCDLLLLAVLRGNLIADFASAGVQGRSIHLCAH